MKFSGVITIDKSDVQYCPRKKSMSEVKGPGHRGQNKFGPIWTVIDPFHKDFSPSGEQLEHRKLAHGL